MTARNTIMIEGPLVAGAATLVQTLRTRLEERSYSVSAFHVSERQRLKDDTSDIALVTMVAKSKRFSILGPDKAVIKAQCAAQLGEWIR